MVVEGPVDDKEDDTLDDPDTVLDYVALVRSPKLQIGGKKFKPYLTIRLSLSMILSRLMTSVLYVKSRPLKKLPPPSDRTLRYGTLDAHLLLCCTYNVCVCFLARPFIYSALP